jgi:hypothetical protein
MERLTLWAVNAISDAGIPASHRFPHGFRPRLTEARAAVELSVLRAESAYLSDYVGDGVEGGYGRTVSGTLAIRLFAPTAAELSAATETALEALKKAPDDATVTAIRGSESTFSSPWDCFTRDIFVDFTGVMPVPAREDVYLELDGEKVAQVEEYRAHSRRTSRMVYSFGESAPAGILRGQEEHNLHLRRIRCAGDVDLFSREDFTLTLVRPAGRVRYTGCRWKEVEEGSRGGTVESALLCATGRVAEEDDDAGNAV